MKSLIIGSLILMSSVYAEVECYYQFTDSILTITPQMKVNSCTADFIWGTKNVCFKGSPKSLVKKINEGFYNWPSSGLKVTEAKVIDKDTVSYLGIDAQNFYSSLRKIERCESNKSITSEVTCVLRQGNQESKATINQSELDSDGYAYKYSLGAEFDLSMNLELYCEGTKCEGNIIIDSQILEDEAGGTGFDFDFNQTRAGEIHSETVTGAPDGLEYNLKCYLNSQM